MPKMRLSANEVRTDIRAGMDDATLMQKYGLSAKALASLFKKLVDAGIVTQSELEARTGSPERPTDIGWTCPACGATQPHEFQECPRCGIVPSKYKRPEGPSSDQTAQAAVSPSATHDRGILQRGDRGVLITIGVLVAAAVLGVYLAHKNTVPAATAKPQASAPRPKVARPAPEKEIKATPENLVNAAARGDLRTIEFILAAGVEVNAVGQNTRSLVAAAENGQTETVRYLLQAGADVNAPDVNGYSALLKAVSKRHTETVEVLVDAGANVNQGNRQETTPLALAKQLGYTALANYLESKGAMMETVAGKFSREVRQLTKEGEEFAKKQQQEIDEIEDDFHRKVGEGSIHRQLRHIEREIRKSRQP